MAEDQYSFSELFSKLQNLHFLIDDLVSSADFENAIGNEYNVYTTLLSNVKFMSIWLQDQKSVEGLKELFLQLSAIVNLLMANKMGEKLSPDSLRVLDTINQLHNGLGETKMLMRLQTDNLDKFNSMMQPNENHKKERKTSERLDQLLSALDKLETTQQQKLSGLNEIYDAEKIYLETKRREIDNALGHLSADSIARGFDLVSKSELNSANFFRMLSLMLMSTIVYVIIGSIHQDSAFNIDQTISKILISLILSVPAAYLARESSRHREKHYQYNRISLEMNALGPFLAPLDDDDKKKIRAVIAMRLFATDGKTTSTTDTYPINTHELLVKIIETINPKNEKDNKKEKTE
jgi:hypothetical protein